MSSQAVSWVWTQDIAKANLKYTLLALAENANTDGYVCQRVKAIAKMTGYTPRTIRKNIGELQSLGYLLPAGKGPQGEKRWQLTLVDEVVPPPCKNYLPPPVIFSPPPPPLKGIKFNYVKLTGTSNLLQVNGTSLTNPSGSCGKAPPSRRRKEPQKSRASHPDSATPDKSAAPSQMEGALPGSKASRQERDAPANRAPTQPKQVQKDMVEALVEVTHIDPQIQTNYGHLCREVKDLWLAGYTAADLHSLFGKGGVWYDQDWRGRRGQPPTIKQVRENIKRLQDQNTSPVFHGGVKLTPAQAEQRREHYRQLSRKRQLTPQSDPQKP